MSGGRIRVDLDQLADVVALLAGQHSALEALAARLASELSRLHESWEGSAAAGHLDAQARWDQGFAAMRDALAGMRSAADTARGNYTAAAEANRAMWRELR